MEWNNGLEAYREETLGYLFDKLNFIKLQPKNILLIGNPRIQSPLLETMRARYPQAQCDFVFQHLRDHPLPADHHDLIFCHWLQPLDLVPEDFGDSILSAYEFLFYLLHHLLKPGGLLLFSQLGPKTHSLKQPDLALATMAPPLSVQGDALLKLDYQDPVLDRDCFDLDTGKLELIYGHAWKKAEKKPTMGCFAKTDKDGNVFMPLENIEHLRTVP